MSALAHRDAPVEEASSNVDESIGVFAERLPEFDTIGGTAYAHSSDKNVYILVQNKNVPPRKTLIDGYNRIKASSLSDLRDAKILASPEGQAACFFMQKPRGGKVFHGKPIGDKLLRNLVLPNILGVFKAMHDESLSYRHLTPDRIYFLTETREEVLLLEAFSVPGGLEHPFSYEPIGRGMVDPVARGEGTDLDDYYALGMLIAHLMLGRDPIGGRSEQSFQQARMSQGSFAAVVSGSSITGAVSALLRGLLQDDAEQRWGYKDVMSWLNGELRSTTPANSGWILSQPVNFANRTLTDRRALAAALQNNPDAALSLYNRNTSTQWVAQICPGAEAHQALVNLLDYGSSTKRIDATANTSEALLARFCSLLDPTGPVRYRTVTLMADGLGPYFASSYLQGDKEKLGDLQSLMGGNVWHSLMDIRALMAGPESQLDQMNSRVAWLRDARQVNDGLERALYALNEGLPCHSNEVGEAWATTPMQALRALDKRCLGSTEGIKLDDSDLLAFLAARAPGIRHLALGISKLRVEAKDAMLLKMLGELHHIFGSPQLKGLCRLFQVRFKKRIGQLKSKTRRELLANKVAEATEYGNLYALSKLVNIDRLQDVDSRGYAKARLKVRKIEHGMKFASREISPNDPTAIAKAAQFSSYLGGFLLVGSLLMRVL